MINKIPHHLLLLSFHILMFFVGASLIPDKIPDLDKILLIGYTVGILTGSFFLPFNPTKP